VEKEVYHIITIIVDNLGRRKEKEERKKGRKELKDAGFI